MWKQKERLYYSVMVLCIMLMVGYVFVSFFWAYLINPIALYLSLLIFFIVFCLFFWSDKLYVSFEEEKKMETTKEIESKMQEIFGKHKRISVRCIQEKVKESISSCEKAEYKASLEYLKLLCMLAQVQQKGKFNCYAKYEVNDKDAKLNLYVSVDENTEKYKDFPKTVFLKFFERID